MNHLNGTLPVCIIHIVYRCFFSKNIEIVRINIRICWLFWGSNEAPIFSDYSILWKVNWVEHSLRSCQNINQMISGRSWSNEFWVVATSFDLSHLFMSTLLIDLMWSPAVFIGRLWRNCINRRKSFKWLTVCDCCKSTLQLEKLSESIIVVMLLMLCCV